MLLPTTVLLLLTQIATAAPRTLDEITDALGEPVSLRMPRTELPPDRAVGFMERAWSLWGGKIQSGGKYFSFSKPDWLDTSSPVLQIWYPKGSFGADGGGGAHFYSTALRDETNGEGKELGSMLVSYEVAFEPGFEFHLGGKLPGLRGGNPDGCGGGLTSDGLHCESTRLMFREEGAGEVYAYIPRTAELCSEPIPRVECNPQYGTSLSRGSFYFPSDGSWSKVSLFVVLNSPATASNGIIQIYFNGELAMSHENLQIRASEKIFEGGLWFSSFFGGGNTTWASPRDQHSYFRNFEQSGSTMLSEDWPTPTEEEEQEPTAEETSTPSASIASATGAAASVAATPLHAAVSASPAPSSSQLSAASISALISRGAVWVGVIGAVLLI